METDFQQVIKNLMDKGITQVAIAERCSITQAYVSRLLTGASKVPSYGVGVKLVNMLKE